MCAHAKKSLPLCAAGSPTATMPAANVVAPISSICGSSHCGSDRFTNSRLFISVGGCRRGYPNCSTGSLVAPDASRHSVVLVHLTRVCLVGTRYRVRLKRGNRTLGALGCLHTRHTVSNGSGSVDNAIAVRAVLSRHYLRFLNRKSH